MSVTCTTSAGSDAPRQADHDQARHVRGIPAEEEEREGEHEDRADDPVLQEGQAEDLPIAEDVPELFVAHLCEGRVHHEDETDRYGNVGCSDLESIDEPFHPGHEIPQPVTLLCTESSRDLYGLLSVMPERPAPA
jgi:hypothetical protein